jgi:hypothetical protein
MKIEKVHEIITKDDAETFEVPEFVGQPAPAAYLINYKNYGYGKFRYD